MTATAPARVEVIEREIAVIEAELDIVLPRVEELRERRTALWQECRDLGVDVATIARWSRKQPVTIRKQTKAPAR